MSHFPEGTPARAAQRGHLAVSVPGDSSVFAECTRHGYGRFVYYGNQRRCLACMRDQNHKSLRKREGVKLTQAQRRAIEEHQHRNDDDYWGDL